MYIPQKKLASGAARNIQKGLCVTGLMLVPVVCATLPVQVFWMVVCQQCRVTTTSGLPKRDVTEAGGENSM